MDLFGTQLLCILILALFGHTDNDDRQIINHSTITIHIIGARCAVIVSLLHTGKFDGIKAIDCHRFRGSRGEFRIGSPAEALEGVDKSIAVVEVRENIFHDGAEGDFLCAAHEDRSVDVIIGIESIAHKLYQGRGIGFKLPIARQCRAVLCPRQILKGDIICGSISGVVGIRRIAFIGSIVLVNACDRGSAVLFAPAAELPLPESPQAARNSVNVNTDSIDTYLFIFFI